MASVGTGTTGSNLTLNVMGTQDIGNPNGLPKSTVDVLPKNEKPELGPLTDLAKAIETGVANQRPLLPSPGPETMPGLTEYASQLGMKNGDG
uniref:Uncharacterized protein n=1 Tax=Trichuris muris TaxID=70415 RepID=A0A5S6QML5_TRIMR